MQNGKITYFSIDVKYNLRNINNFIFLHLDMSFLIKQRRV